MNVCKFRDISLSVFNILIVSIIIFIYSNNVNAEKITKIQIGHLETQQIILQNKKIKDKNVFALFYQDPKGFVFYRAIDKVTYAKIDSYLNKVKNYIINQNSAFGLFGCAATAEVQQDSKNQIICFDHADIKNQKAFNKWFIQTAKLAQGELTF